MAKGMITSAKFQRLKGLNLGVYVIGQWILHISNIET